MAAITVYGAAIAVAADSVAVAVLWALIAGAESFGRGRGLSGRRGCGE